MRTTRAWISAKPAHVHSVCSPSRVEASAFGARGGVNPMPFIWIMMASDGPPPLTDRKSTRLNSSHEWNLVCRLLLEKKKRKEPSQRYRTADEMREDIARYVKGR